MAFEWLIMFKMAKYLQKWVIGGVTESTHFWKKCLLKINFEW